MIINITLPSRYSLWKTKFRTKRFYNLHQIGKVVEGHKKSYYLLISEKNIQIQIIDLNLDMQKELQGYIEFLFKNNYIGITKGFAKFIDLKNVRVFEV